MLKSDALLWCLLGLVVLALGLVVFRYTSDTKLRRRRRKSHSRIVSKSRRPMVRFSVKPPKEK
jgi:hypothetical protein